MHLSWTRTPGSTVAFEIFREYRQSVEDLLDLVHVLVSQRGRLQFSMTLSTLAAPLFFPEPVDL